MALLTGLTLLFIWYQVFWENLWPRYQQLKKDHEEYLAMDLDLPAQLEMVQDREELLAEIRSNVDRIKNKLPSSSGFLVYTVSQLAEGRVHIKEMEPGDSRTGPFYQVNGLRILCEGDFSGLLEYLRLLEDQAGLSISSLDIQGGPSLAESLEMELLLQHYSVQQDGGMGPDHPSTYYKPYEPYNVTNPFGGERIPDQRVQESEPEEVIPMEEVELHPLAPYTFPVR